MHIVIGLLLLVIGAACLHKTWDEARDEWEEEQRAKHRRERFTR